MREVLIEILAELERANEKHGPMPDIVAGFYTIKCELTELEREVMMCKRNKKAMYNEAIQTAAMCLKFIDGFCNEQKKC